MTSYGPVNHHDGVLHGRIERTAAGKVRICADDGDIGYGGHIGFWDGLAGRAVIPVTAELVSRIVTGKRTLAYIGPTDANDTFRRATGSKVGTTDCGLSISVCHAIFYDATWTAHRRQERIDELLLNSSDLHRSSTYAQARG